ncbi:hypothetical protein [Roseomonas sp. KE2513]|uniref:hypothetical protein n=1 Tax=Roseomonas sp. KE2513 TaxID=2479202 RepID=UPI0018DFFE44|nr:hypothetical protein [Roseomonas sp. KE2513]
MSVTLLETEPMTFMICPEFFWAFWRETIAVGCFSKPESVRSQPTLAHRQWQERS